MTATSKYYSILMDRWYDTFIASLCQFCRFGPSHETPDGLQAAEEPFVPTWGSSHFASSHVGINPVAVSISNLVVVGQVIHWQLFLFHPEITFFATIRNDVLGTRVIVRGRDRGTTTVSIPGRCGREVQPHRVVRQVQLTENWKKPEGISGGWEDPLN